MKRPVENSSTQPQYYWKKRPSEIRNYIRTLYCNADNRDYFRVDYNLKDRLVRLHVEIAEEGGNAYYSVIKDGKVTVEKSIASGRTFGFSEKFRDRADVFSTIPNNEVIKLINKNYNIDFPAKKPAGLAERRRRYEETRRRYFKREEIVRKAKHEKMGITLSEFKLVDLLDIIIGFLVSGAVFFLLQFDYIAMGVVAAFYGFFIGLIDMIFRSRPPFFMKMIFFIFIGVSSYIYGYFIP